MVYFIQGRITKLIKIGRCESIKNFKNRITHLQSASPDRFILLGIVDESLEINENTLHTMFAKFWDHGEWFEPDSQLLNFIEKYATTQTIRDGKIWTKHRKLKSLKEAKDFKVQPIGPKDLEFKNSRELIQYVKDKLAG